MRKLTGLMIMTLGLLLLSGCSLLNPYSAKFDCPNVENGKCVSIPKAYEESVTGGNYLIKDADLKSSSTPSTSSGAAGPEQDAKAKAEKPVVNAEGNYQDALYKRVGGLLENPQTPIVVAPQVVRVLILPYTGEGNMLYAQRHLFFFADKPRWILNNMSYGE